MVEWQQDGPKRSPWVERKEYIFSSEQNICLCLFSKSHFEKHSDQTSCDASIAPVSAGENVLPLSSLDHVITVPKESRGTPVTPVP